MTSVLIRRGEHHVTAEEGHMATEMGVMQPQAKQHQGWTATSRSWKGHRRILPRSLQRQHGSADTLTWDFQVPGLWENTFPLLDATSLWYFVQQPSDTSTNGTPIFKNVKVITKKHFLKKVLSLGSEPEGGEEDTGAIAFYYKPSRLFIFLTTHVCYLIFRNYK